MLTDPQIERYARHILLRDVGKAGQERLLDARVAVVGLGPAGAWATAYLALAGVGRLELWDDAAVGEDDLAPFLGPAVLGRRRDEALAAAVATYNPDVTAVVATPSSGADGVVLTDPALCHAAEPEGRCQTRRPLFARDACASIGPALGRTDRRTSLVVALAAGERAIAGVPGGGGPCAACVARVLETESLSENPIFRQARSAEPEGRSQQDQGLLREARVGKTGPAHAGPVFPTGLADRPAPGPALAARAALAAGSLAAAATLVRIAAGAGPADGFLLADGTGLRRIEPKAIACSHR